MQINRRNQFITIRTEGAILPSDLLKKIADNDKSIDGLTPEAYHLEAGEKLNEAISSAWNRLLGAWSTFKSAREKLSQSDAGTTITRERWLLPLFNHLGYGRLQLSKGILVNNEPFPVSHVWQKTPIHLIGCNIELDRRTPGQAGAARMSPHGLMQQLLNRSDDHLWAFLSNGLTLRILRDNIALTRQAYVEFDLETMMDNEVYSDFILLFLLCHQSRVEAERPEECWLERWSKLAQDQGIRALNQLRAGVEEAIIALGKGFISHHANSVLKANLKSGALSKEDYYRELLRLIYRLIFLFVAEDRELLFTKGISPKARELYTRFYSTGRLRRLATRRKGTQHSDQWQGLKLVFEKLGKDEGCPELGLPALGSFLWSKDATRHLDSCELANADLLAAIRALTVTTDSKARRPVDYKNLGSEELGSIYESLLELHPQINSESGSFDLGTVGGNERKTTGSYYTPSSLVQCLLDSALDPVLDEAAKKDHPEKAILDLKICDPACGSGHFLIAASHRVAKRLAAIRTGDDEPSPEATRTALRDIIGHCVYGVDLNPLAVELCKVSLWMEALEPGKPLSFLEHKILCGNSLLGATPALLEKGIPDDAFKPIEGDDKTFCSEYRKANKKERENTGQSLFAPGGMPWEQLGNHAAAMMNLDDISDDTIDAIHTKEERYARALQSGSYFTTRFWADSWCAAFVWKKKKAKELPFPITEDIFRKIEKSPYDVPIWMKDEIIRLKDQYKFFHWHIAFPTVFRISAKDNKPENEQIGWSGGFDVVLGNPPWETWEFKTQDFFNEPYPNISVINDTNIRNKEIDKLQLSDPPTYNKYLEKKYEYYASKRFMTDSSLYILSNRGKINLYSKFLEIDYCIAKKGVFGLGVIIPGDIATGFDSSDFIDYFIHKDILNSLYHFHNKLGIFDIHRDFRFVLLALGPSTEAIRFIFNALNIADLRDNEKIIKLTKEDISLINPNTKNCPIFNNNKDFELIKTIYLKATVINNNGINAWDIHNHRMINASDDAEDLVLMPDLIQNNYEFKDDLVKIDGKLYYPVYESKLIWHHDNRFASYKDLSIDKIKSSYPGQVDERDKSKPYYYVWTRDYIDKNTADSKWLNRYKRNWFIIYRNVTGIANNRTTVASIIPKRPVVLSAYILEFGLQINPKLITAFYANINSMIFDYISRQKIGGSHLSVYIFDQLPTILKGKYTSELLEFISKRVLELDYTTFILSDYANDLEYKGPPFCWDEERRFKIRCELDAAYFHLYLGTPKEWQKQGTPELLRYFPAARHAVEYIMETFPIVKRKDEAKNGTYRTKDLILDIYDAMADSIRTGTPYQTILDPPPGPPTNPDGTFAPLPAWPTGAPKPKDWPAHIHEPRR